MRRGILWSLLIVAGVGLMCDATRAQGPSPDAIAEPGRPDDVEEQQRREKTFTAGVLLLAGVTAIGLLLIAAALIWGAKVRRMVRRPEPATGPQDDLWYLRKNLSAEDLDAPREDTPPAAEDRGSQA